MIKRKRTGDTADRFVEATIRLITEQGGSVNVNLRTIAKEVGCAHTNVYNYFAGLDDLMWASMEHVLGILGEYLTRDLSDNLSPHEYLNQVVTNYVSFAEEQPGFFRFISTDPLVSKNIPEKIISPVEAMLDFFSQVFERLSGGKLNYSEANDVRNVLLAYLDGELLNMINGRSVPIGADVHDRIIHNALRLYELLTSTTNNGVKLKSSRSKNEKPYPKLTLHSGKL